jgi:hypothetical protein
MTDSLARILFLLHVAATLYMVGVIWFVQVVHYPLMGQVGSAEAVAYEREHSRLTGWVVGPPMLAELFTGMLLVWFRVLGIPAWQIWAGLLLIAIIWASTWALQIPCHNRLSQVFNAADHHRLVSTNWIRTVCWTLRGLLVLGMTQASRL